MAITHLGDHLRVVCDHCARQTVFTGTMNTVEEVKRNIENYWYRVETPQGDLHYDTLQCVLAEQPWQPIIRPTQGSWRTDDTADN